MRTFHWNAPIIGAGALVLSVLLPALSPLKAEEIGANDVAAVATSPAPQGLTELKTSLDRSDRTVALQALQMALSELGDGVTLVWRRPISQEMPKASARHPSRRAISSGTPGSRSPRSSVSMSLIEGRSRLLP